MVSMQDSQSGALRDVVSFSARRASLTYVPIGIQGNSLSKVRSQGFKASTFCRFACAFTLTAKVTQKTAKALRLKSRTIAKRRFEQLPSMNYSSRGRNGTVYVLPLVKAGRNLGQ